MTLFFLAAHRLAQVAPLHVSIFQTLKFASPVHLQALSKEPPFQFHSRVWAIQDRRFCHSATITASVRGGRSFISGGSLSVSQPNQPRLPYSVQLSFLFLRFLLHSTRQSTSFSVWHWLCFISAEQNVQSVHSCNCVIDDKAHKKNLTRNLFTYLDFIDNGLTTSTHTLSVLSK